MRIPPGFTLVNYLITPETGEQAGEFARQAADPARLESTSPATPAGQNFLHLTARVIGTPVAFRMRSMRGCQ